MVVEYVHFLLTCQATILLFLPKENNMQMDKNNPPTSFGVFKPVGHTVIGLASASALAKTTSLLQSKGFGTTSLIVYTPKEMVEQCDSDLLSAGVLAEIGQDLNMVKAHRELALSGASFLVVYAPDAGQQELVDSVIEEIKPIMAQRYGRLITEDLVKRPEGQTQRPESPETGIDKPDHKKG
jgi:hypothetical protein